MFYIRWYHHLFLFVYSDKHEWWLPNNIFKYIILSGDRSENDSFDHHHASKLEYIWASPAIKMRRFFSLLWAMLSFAFISIKSFSFLFVFCCRCFCCCFCLFLGLVLHSYRISSARFCFNILRAHSETCL